MWNTNATEVRPSTGLAEPSTANQRRKSIQQSANSIMNVFCFRLTEYLTSGRYTRSPETVCNQMLWSTYQRPLVRYHVVRTLLSVIPFVSTLYRQFEGWVDTYPYVIYHSKVELAMHLKCHATGIFKWKSLRFCYTPHFYEWEIWRLMARL